MPYRLFDVRHSLSLSVKCSYGDIRVSNSLEKAAHGGGSESETGGYSWCYIGGTYGRIVEVDNVI